MSVSELARAVRLSEGAIRNLEQGPVRKGPYLPVGLRLAGALGVSAYYLWFGDDGDPEETELHSMRARIEELERQVLEINALNRRGSTSEAQGADGPPRTAPE